MSPKKTRESPASETTNERDIKPNLMKEERVREGWEERAISYNMRHSVTGREKDFPPPISYRLTVQPVITGVPEIWCECLDGRETMSCRLGGCQIGKIPAITKIDNHVAAGEEVRGRRDGKQVEKRKGHEPYPDLQRELRTPAVCHSDLLLNNLPMSHPLYLL